MSDVPRLLQAFESDHLHRPSARVLNTIDLVRGLAMLAGAREVEPTPGTDVIKEVIGPAEHYVFVLVDSLGMNILDRLPEESFLRRHFRRELRATFPSTTAAALTSIATGAWPNRHAVTGWWVHLPEFGFTATILPFMERFSHEPMTARGLSATEVFPVPSLYPSLGHEPLVLQPKAYIGSVYSVYWRGGTPGQGLGSIDQGIDVAIRRVGSAERPSFTYLYLPDVDTLSHYRGYDHRDTIALTNYVDSELSRLADGIGGKARLVVSADHGQTNVPHEDRLVLRDGDPLLELLYAPPSGVAPVPLFHVRDGRVADFRSMFRDRFAERYWLISIAEAEELELFGPAPMSPVARGRFGDYIGIPHRPATLKHYLQGTLPEMDYLGVHGALFPDEMRVPLVVA